MDNEKTSLPLAGTSSPAPAHPPLAGGPASTVAPAAAAPVPAVASVPLFGGLRGGRPRKDGLKPGSEEAKAADRAADAERKRLARERERASQPPLLPAAPGAGPSPAPGATPPEAADVPAVDGAPFVGVELWSAEDAAPLATETLEMIETLEVEALRTKIERLSEPVAREVEKDLAWNKPAKKSIGRGSAALLAKGLNAAGVSKSTGELLNLVPGLALLLAQRRGLHRRLDQLLAAAKQQAQEKKP